MATTAYGVNLLLTSVLLSVLWRYAAHEQLVRPEAAEVNVRTITNRLTPELGGYVVLIVSGVFLPILAVVGHLAIAVFMLVPFGAFRCTP